MAQATSGAPSTGRRVWKWLLRIVAFLVVAAVVVALVAGLWLWNRLRGSLPPLDGELEVAGLERPLTVERDALGVVTLRGESRLDVAFGTGFVHAQDRFFQMDVFRRQAAGELGEIVPQLLPLDRVFRRHRFRALAQEVLAAMPAPRRALVEAYAAGVNAGLATLDTPPPEYLALGAKPAPWLAEDSVLVLLVMFVVLQDDGDDEAMLALLHERLPEELFEFLTPLGTSWDAPLAGEPLAVPPLPGPEAVDLHHAAEPPAAQPASGPAEPAPPGVPEEASGASNAWAVAAARSADGAALLAVDTHAGLSVPNLWYRTAFVWGAGDDAHRVDGVTLAGTPPMVLGSNGHVAWGFTNPRLDSADLILVERDPENEDAYLTPEGSEPFTHYREVLLGGKEEKVLDVVWTRWGPVVGEAPGGELRALSWLPHEAGAVNLDFLEMETARNVDEAVEIARKSGLPAQNLLLADRDGRIAWTVAGRLPRRVGLDGRLPSSWAQDGRRWDGLLPPEEVPAVVDPPEGLLWSANNRMVGGEDLAKMGIGGNYVLGARARHIRDALRALERPTEADMLALQLDDRSYFLERWRDLILELLTPEATAQDPRRGEMREHVAAWQGRASVDSVGYRLIRELRDEAAAKVFAALLAPCLQEEPELDYFDDFKQAEGPLWALVSQRPANLLPAEYESWDELLLAAADAVLARAQAQGIPLAQYTWGARNTTSIRHLFSRALPAVLASRVDMPAEPLPGDRFLPRVQDPDTGATMRMVVSPGQEEEGLLHMPGGQSGHFLSPHYRDSHAAWSRGEPTPLLPGEPVDTLVLRPRS